MHIFSAWRTLLSSNGSMSTRMRMTNVWAVSAAYTFIDGTSLIAFQISADGLKMLSTCPPCRAAICAAVSSPEIDVDQAVQVGQRLAVGAHLPVVLAALELGALGGDVLVQQEWAGADRLLGDVAFEGLGHDHRRVVEQVLGHGDLRRIRCSLMV